MNWLHYLAEANLYLGVFYLAYCVFLNKETYYQLNRVYLIFSCIISFILPVLQISTLRSLPKTESFSMVYVAPPPPPMSPVAIVAVEQPYQLTLTDVLWYGYMLGAAILLLVLAIRLYNLLRIVRIQKYVEQGSYKLIYIKDSQSAFSFFNYLFIGTDAPGVDTIIKHELVHIHQKHSADIIFLEILKIINWFNPFIYLLQNSLKTVHEYIADEQTAIFETDALAYSSFLVNNAYGISGPSITQPFSTYHLLKKRIIMLNQQRSGNLARLKYLVAVPICAGLLCASTLGFSKTYGWVDLAPKHITQQPKRVPPPPPMPPKSNSTKGTETEPQPVGGIQEFYKFMGKNMRYPKEMFDKNVQGTVIVQFMVETDGSLSDIKAVRGPGYGAEEESVRVIGLSPKWIPGKLNGKVARLQYTMPVKFTLGAIAPASNKPKTDQVKFPPPIVVADAPKGYEELRSYLAKLGYPEHIKNALNGSVLVGYTINDDHKISNIKLIRGAGNGFDEVAINHLNTYPGTIADEPGEHALNIIFFTPGYHLPFVNQAVKSTPGYSGELFIRVPPPPPIAPPKHKTDQVKFPPPIVKPKTDQVKFPPPIVKPDKLPKFAQKYFAAFADLRSYLMKTIRYTKEAKEQNISKQVTTTFNIDADGLIKDARISYNSSEYFDEAILKALNAYTEKIAVKADTYSLVFQFNIFKKNEHKFSPPVVLTPGLAGVINITVIGD